MPPSSASRPSAFRLACISASLAWPTCPACCARSAICVACALTLSMMPMVGPPFRYETDCSDAGVTHVGRPEAALTDGRRLRHRARRGGLAGPDAGCRCADTHLGMLGERAAGSDLA